MPAKVAIEIGPPQDYNSREMFIDSALNPVLKILGLSFQVLAVFFLIRGILWAIGFSYNIPIVDDIFFGIIGTISSWGTEVH